MHKIYSTNQSENPAWWPWPRKNNAADKEAENMTWHKMETAEGSRRYALYVPDVPNPKGPHLVLMLHGCFQSPFDFAKGTKLNSYAKELGFYVLYPEQTEFDNPWKCWNWFLPKNQRADLGETFIISQMVKKVQSDFAILPQRTFVLGMSGGGSQALNMINCHREIFKGVVVHSGTEFAGAETELEAHELLKGSFRADLNKTAQAAADCSLDKKKKSPYLMISIHGGKDSMVQPQNQKRVIEQYLLVQDYIDDHKKNDSFKWQRQTEYFKPESDRLFDFEVHSYTGSKNQVYGLEVFVPRLGHAFSGGEASSAFYEPRSYLIVHTILNLFLKANLPDPSWP